MEADGTFDDDLDDGGFDEALGSFRDDARRRVTAQRWTERSDHRVLQGLSGTWLGTLVELAEVGEPVLVHTRAGTKHRARIVAVGPSLVVLTDDGHQYTMLALAAIEAVRERGNGRTRELETIDAGPDMGSLLDEAAQERSRAAVITAGGSSFTGTLLRVGADQVTLRLDGDGDTISLPLGAMDEVVVSR